MIERVKAALGKTMVETEYIEQLVDTTELPDKYKFRGSSTLLIEWKDLEGLPEPESENLSCRYYADGIHEIGQILNIIEKKQLSKGAV